MSPLVSCFGHSGMTSSSPHRPYLSRINRPLELLLKVKHQGHSNFRPVTPNHHRVIQRIGVSRSSDVFNSFNATRKKFGDEGSIYDPARSFQLLSERVFNSFNATRKKFGDEGSIYDPARSFQLLSERALSSINMSPGARSMQESNVSISDGTMNPRKKGVSGDVAAASLIASSALIFEAIQFLGTTAVAIFIHRALPETSSIEEAIRLLSGSIQDMGAAGYFAYAGVQMLFQVFPVASAFAMTMSAGVVFGSVKNGVALISVTSTISAAISFLLARSVQGRFQGFKENSSQLRAIDTALADAGFFNSVLLMCLMRSSPIIPFSWANYLFGISRVPFVPFVLGTFLGTLPGITAFVSAGSLGKEALSGNASGFAVQAGLVATILSVILIGRISDATLKEMNIDLTEESSS
eukprot:CAMPEP_0184503172 /NCGR_PEP_ID=MMETSP0113_2-20130426/51734_1 /TAXON_ID=91329 /ORGANISM="Norrisiella sphaerica, Strain BC52" /LENGTH=409 /DNA_ID=CAMNT_0026892619 /DNA_START=462 /DNA_END=1691 /DNA_ORIENTATION=-